MCGTMQYLTSCDNRVMDDPIKPVPCHSCFRQAWANECVAFFSTSRLVRAAINCSSKRSSANSEGEKTATQCYGTPGEMLRESFDLTVASRPRSATAIPA